MFDFVNIFPEHLFDYFENAQQVLQKYVLYPQISEAKERIILDKHITSQRYVFKIHSSRLRRAKWNLQLSVKQAHETKELVALNDSQLLRFIDELNQTENTSQQIAFLKKQITLCRSQKNPASTCAQIKKLYAELDDYLFKKDYVCIVMDNNRDYLKLCKNGFQINGISYRRLLGTTSGVKSSTIVFVNETLLPELKKRIDNGRNLTKKFTPAKLEAYNSLVCSSSTPVSMPNGIAVVRDCVTHFKADVIELDDSRTEQPRMKYLKNKEMTLIDSDGYGIAMPQLMQRWGKEIGKDFVLPGCVIRNAFCKGAVFPIDFQKFAQQHQVSHITDVWGNSYPVEEIDLILTESMLKLWDSYSSIEDYLRNCKKNRYTFAITKASEQTLEHARNMNYQFLQSYDFTEEQIEELIAPTVNEIHDILSNDYRKTILYAKGTRLNEKNIQPLDNSFATALMIEPLMASDPYIKRQIHTMIKKRIDDAKVGVLKVPANYSFVSGDPYSLCQSMLGMEVTGLLKAGEIYSQYWSKKGVDKIVSFRAPMTSHNNIRLLKVVHNEEMDAFYQYMTTPTIFNSWDTCAEAMNGFDKDGDCVINTSFPLLVKHTKELPAIVCVQRKSPKCLPTEEDMIQANINSFGNDIGQITNHITSMFEVQSRYEKDSRAYRLLDYRIKCGQLYQQNQIDKAKGIEAKQMPETWYQKKSGKTDTNGNSRQKKNNFINHTLAADKKPYFMQYIYPSEKIKFRDYLKKSNEKCLMRFRIPIETLLAKPQRTPEEETFLKHYHAQMPLGMGPCTINKICWKIESVFDDITFCDNTDFDYSILKCDAVYSKQLCRKIKKIYEQYQKQTTEYMQYAKVERIKSDERRMQKYLFQEDFQRQCLEQCPNPETLCNIVLDLCYGDAKASKQFAWDICGDIFIQNLLKHRSYMISYPTLDENGDIEFNGMHFSMKTTQIKPNPNLFSQVQEEPQ